VRQLLTCTQLTPALHRPCCPHEPTHPDIITNASCQSRQHVVVAGAGRCSDDARAARAGDRSAAAAQFHTPSRRTWSVPPLPAGGADAAFSQRCTRERLQRAISLEIFEPCRFPVPHACILSCQPFCAHARQSELHASRRHVYADQRCCEMKHACSHIPSPTRVRTSVVRQRAAANVKKELRRSVPPHIAANTAIAQSLGSRFPSSSWRASTFPL
jgi:hypothetical protein